MTGFPIRSLAFDERSGSYLVGDTNGGVYALGDAGWTLFSARASTSSVEAFLPEGAGLVGVPREGAWFAVRPAAMQSASDAAPGVAWTGVDALLAVALASAAVRPCLAGGRPRARLGVSWGVAARQRLRLPSLAMIALFS